MRLIDSRWFVLGASIVAALGTARLGLWQLDRAAQKTALQQAQQNQRALPPLIRLPRGADAVPLHRAVRLQGRWLANTVYLENRQMNGRPGFFALTPLMLDDGAVVLVQRGWLPRDAADRSRIAFVPTPAGPVQLHGRIAPAPSRLHDFAGAASGPIRQNIDLGDFARESGLALLPYTVRQEEHDGALADGLQRQWLQPAANVQMHYGYAFQWFALSALVIGLYVWFQFVGPRFTRQHSRP